METNDFTWVVGLPQSALDMGQQDFDDLVARLAWDASAAAKAWRARKLARRREMDDAA